MTLPDPVSGEPDLQPTRRQRRADALRRKALSPFRIIVMVLALPLTTGIIAVNIYLRTSDFDRNGAVMHLIALAGCDAMHTLGFGPFRKGYPGYHKRYDPDGDWRVLRPHPETTRAIYAPAAWFQFCGTVAGKCEVSEAVVARSGWIPCATP